MQINGGLHAVALLPSSDIHLHKSVGGLCGRARQGGDEEGYN